MKKSTRFLSLLLSIIMILGILPVSSLAANEAPLKRYTVLVLDTSSSATFLGSSGTEIYTADTAINYVKKAAKSFFSSLLNADGTNYVAVVSYKSTATTVSDFSTDVNSLSTKVDNLTASGTTRDISAGLAKANDLLSTIADGENIKKNVVLFTTGMTNNGSYSYDGKYGEETIGSNWRRMDTQVRLYAYANNAISVAENVKTHAKLYTIGLFQTMDGMPTEGKDIAEFFKLTACDLATSKDYFYQVDDPDNLEFTFGDVAESITNEVIESNFKWAGSLLSNRDQLGTCYYTDDYFLESSTKNNPHLRTMSLAFELTTWSSNEFKKAEEGWTDDETVAFARWQNARDLLCGIDGNDNFPGLGFTKESFMVNDFWGNRPTKDSIGLVAASKTLSDGSTLVALAIRGGGYEQEWASNFTIGRTGDHDGFAEARDNTLDFLDTYLVTKNITGSIKLWIVGYSRAGVTANMVGGALDSGYSMANGATVAFNDLFVYAFEPPQGAMKENTSSGNYSNIHNIVNVNDIVPMVAPFAWGFTRYNSDFWIPSEANTASFNSKKQSMLKILNSFDGMSNAYSFYKIMENVPQHSLQINWSKILPGGDPFIEIIDFDVSTNYAMNTSVNFLANDVLSSRTIYYSDWQAGVREIMALLNGGSLSDLAGEGISLGDFIDKFFSELTFDRICEILSPAFSLNPFYSIADRKSDIKGTAE